jgi:hypothetical protein
MCPAVPSVSGVRTDADGGSGDSDDWNVGGWGGSQSTFGGCGVSSVTFRCGVAQGSQAAGAPFSKRILHIAYSSGTSIG